VSAELLDDDTPLEAAGWRIRTEDDAGRYLRALRHARARKTRLADEAKRRRTEITERLEALLGPIDHDIERREAALIDYRRWLESQDPGLPKTHSLIDGDLCRRQQPAQLVIDDEAAFIQWASEHEPDLLRVKVEIDRTSDRWKTLTTTDDGTLVDPVLGHKIEHVRQVRPEDKYSVKTPAGSVVQAVEA